MRGAVFFDVDGTLVPGTSSSQHLARSLGHLTALADAEDEYAAGRMNNHQVSVLDARGWRGHTPSTIDGYLQNIPLVDGIAEVVSWCAENHFIPYLTTLAWQPVGDYLCGRFGFAGACGPSLEQDCGRYTGAVAHHFDEFNKRDFALNVAKELRISPSSCAAVGDSRSDLPLFQVVDLSIGFNASAHVRKVADVSVEGADLRAVLPALDHWLHTV